jgi:hypothetical protein
MPNWCSNSVQVEGPADEVKRFKEFVAGDNGSFDFNRILPRPEIYDYTASGGRTFDGKSHRSWYSPPRNDPPTDLTGEALQEWHSEEHKRVFDAERPFTPEEQAELRKHGADNWYDWCVNNWGTKWNAGDVDLAEEYIPENPNEEGMLEYQFDTAWGPPEGIVRKLRKEFPNLTINWGYRLEGDSPYPHSL